MDNFDPTLRESGSHIPVSTRATVGVAQVDVDSGDLKGNLEKLHNLVDEHRDEVDLLVLPEYSLTGYVHGQDALDAAISIESPELQGIAAKTDGVTLAVNFIEQSSDEHYYDSLAFLRDGHVLAVHRKIYLVAQGPFNERGHLNVGAEHRCFNVGAFRYAPFICADAWNPALVHLAAMDRASVFVFAAGSSPQGLTGRLSTPESWRRINRFYSSIYGSYVLFVNRVGQDGHIDFWGGSQILNPYGEVIADTETGEESFISAEIDLTLSWQARRELPAYTDRDLDFTPPGGGALNQTVAQPIEAYSPTESIG